MKNTIIFLTLLLFAIESFGQAPTNQAFSKDFYLKKSKSQKKTAWILLGTGLGIAATGVVVQLIEADARSGYGWFMDFTGTFIAMGGCVVALSSIPFFISSSSNKKKAASLAIGNRNIFLPRANSSSLTAQPTITLNIGL